MSQWPDSIYQTFSASKWLLPRRGKSENLKITNYNSGGNGELFLFCLNDLFFFLQHVLKDGYLILIYGDAFHLCIHVVSHRLYGRVLLSYEVLGFFKDGINVENGNAQCEGGETKKNGNPEGDTSYFIVAFLVQVRII